MFLKKNLHLKEITLLTTHLPVLLSAKNRLRIRFCFSLLFFLLLLPLSIAQSQVKEEWVARYDGPGNKYDDAKVLALDNSGNVYVTGTSDGEKAGDYATIKYDTNGNQLWVARYDGPRGLSEWAQDIAVDASGNVYVIGFSERSRTQLDFATVKYDTNGNQMWVRR